MLRHRSDQDQNYSINTPYEVLPDGGIETGESTMEAALRKDRKELGVEVRVEQQPSRDAMTDDRTGGGAAVDAVLNRAGE